MSGEFERNTVVVRAEHIIATGVFTPPIDWDEIAREDHLDRTVGPRLGPPWSQLWEIERPQRMAANLRDNLGNGRPAGPYRR